MTMQCKAWVFVLAVALTVPPIAVLAQPAAEGGTAFTGAVGETQTGLAAVYSRKLNGRRTASGERFNQHAMTTAHQTLPFGTKVRITRIKTGKSVVLRVNDRGPTQPNRIVDISQAAARALRMKPNSMAQVKLEVTEAAKRRVKKSK